MSKTEDFQSDLTFPADLGSGKTSAKNSVALFSARLKKDKEFSYYIYLPAPTGLAVNDQANYNTTDFGLTGAENKFGAGTITQTLKALGIKSGRLFGGLATIEDAQVEKVAGLIVNPNTNTSFGGSGVRSFTFAYKFIPESEAEARTIKQIIRRFKALSYAALANSDKENPASLILTYPPVWQIKFLTSGAGGSFSENPFMPKLFDCYLTGVETNYNPAANIFFKGGAPNEIDISVTYQETRALTRNDIDELENTIDQEGNFNNPSDNSVVIPANLL
tara:strand:+ start:2064 stop:2894 length:831 start_codon:yes stop_codon:yes gene_type:complete